MFLDVSRDTFRRVQVGDQTNEHTNEFFMPVKKRFCAPEWKKMPHIDVSCNEQETSGFHNRNHKTTFSFDYDSHMYTHFEEAHQRRQQPAYTSVQQAPYSDVQPPPNSAMQLLPYAAFYQPPYSKVYQLPYTAVNQAQYLAVHQHPSPTYPAVRHPYPVTQHPPYPEVCQDQWAYQDELREEQHWREVEFSSYPPQYHSKPHSPKRPYNRRIEVSCPYRMWSSYLKIAYSILYP